MHPMVIHVRDMQYGDVRVDRKTMWGNPFPITKYCDREEAIRRYRTWLWDRMIANNLILPEELVTLYGKRLACWCAPKACHAEVLYEAAGWAYDQLNGS